jgi:tetratricopeptide (TPR) repeat protein
MKNQSMSQKKTRRSKKSEPISNQFSHHQDGGLTLKQEQFAEAYIDNGGNATEAYLSVYGGSRTSAGELGHRLLKKVEISDAIETKREALRLALGISREKLLRIQVAMAIGAFDDFLEVFKDPGNEDSYRNLGDAKYAIKGVRVGKFGNELILVDRQAALNELWKKLGYDKDSGADRERDPNSSVLNRALEILGKPRIVR